MKVIGNEEEIITKTLSKFYSMSEEEQRLLQFVLIKSYLECLEGMKNNKKESKEYDHCYYQKETYQFILSMFTLPPKELTENGVLSPRDFIFREAQKDYDLMFGKAGQA